MNERAALAVVERDFGSMEDFVIDLLSAKQDALSPDIPMVKRAEIAGLPLPVFARIVSSSHFRQLLRVDLVNQLYDMQAESKHVETIVGVARGKSKKVMSASGAIGEVDQSPTDVIAAGKYLNELRGTPVEKTQSQSPSIVINIGKADPRTDQNETTINVDVESYRPQRAGQLPPSGVRERSGETIPGHELPSARMDPGLSTLYGEGAEDAEEDHAIAEKQSRDEEPEPKEKPRKGWGRRKPERYSVGWPGRGPAPYRLTKIVEEDD